MNIFDTTSEAGCDLSIACLMLSIGVAFQKDGKTWNVFSCWGDELGSLSTHMLGNVNRFMKSKGIAGLHNHQDYSYDGINTTTFSRAGWNVEEQTRLLEEAVYYGYIR
jgi:hypothetical protein